VNEVVSSIRSQLEVFIPAIELAKPLRNHCLHAHSIIREQLSIQFEVRIHQEVIHAGSLAGTINQILHKKVIAARMAKFQLNKPASLSISLESTPQ
jgi:hypothetical protein